MKLYIITASEGACEKCQSFAGTFDKEPLVKPSFHPNCKCKYEVKNIEESVKIDEEKDLKISKVVTKNSSVDLRDSKNLKEKLFKLGFYTPDIRAGETDKKLNPYSNKNLFSAIEKFQKENNLKVDGVVKPNGKTEKVINKTSNSLKVTIENLVNQIATWDNAIGDFALNYKNMKEANTVGADKYFHAKANLEATKRGAGGKFISKFLSLFREIEGGIRSFKNKDKSFFSIIKDAKEDMIANDFGRKQGEKDTKLSNKILLKSLRPKGLENKY